MALYKEIISEQGIPLTYWIIQDFVLDRSKKRLGITLVPYVSEESRRAGYAPMISDKVAVRVEDLVYPEDSGKENVLHYTEYFAPEMLERESIYKAMYNYVKYNIPQFADAIDI